MKNKPTKKLEEKEEAFPKRNKKNMMKSTKKDI